MTINHKKGFTLIELLIVISIITLLTSIILSALQDAKRKSRDSNNISSLQEVRTALQMFFTDKGYYPSLKIFLYPDLIGNKDITEINSNLFYIGLPIGCLEGNCNSYHLGIALEDTGNLVLSNDKDSADGFPGNSTNCLTVGSTPDKCYDIEP